MNDLTEMATLSAGAVPAGVDTAVARATDALLAAQNADGHWVYELEADSTIPAEYVLLVHYSGETPNLEPNRRSAAFAPHPAGRRRLAVHRRRAEHQRERESVFRAEGDRRRRERRAHVTRAAPSTRWAAPRCRTCSRASSSRCTARFRGARGADDASRDHAAAAVVPVPSVEGVVLGAHGDRAAARVEREAPAREEPARRAHRRTSSSIRPSTPGCCRARPPEFRLVRVLPRGRSCVARGRRVVPRPTRANARSARPCRSSTSA